MNLSIFKRASLLFCLCISTFLYGQISIEYPENITVECGLDLSPSEENPNIGYPKISTTCTSGLANIAFSDNIDGLTECSGTGILLRFWSVSDNCGGFMTLLQRITLVDTTPPKTNCVSDIIIECDASLNPSENPDLGFPEISDCSDRANLGISYSDQNEGKGFCDGLPEIVRRTWRIADACGNTSICEQSIRVGKDPLFVFCEIEDNIHECNGIDGSRFAAESWDLSNKNQLRNCTQTECGPVEIVSDFDFGRLALTCGITGSFEVNYLIKDNCGNSKFKAVKFTLRDTTPPESFCNPTNLGLSCEGDTTAVNNLENWHNENIKLLESCLFDNCSQVRVTSNFNPSNFNIDELEFNCSDTIGFIVNYMLTDDCGNQRVKAATIKIVDNTPPIFENIPRDTAIGANDNLPVDQPIVLDNCSTGLNAILSEERIDNNNDEGYQIIKTWIATDDCGNIETATQKIMILDPILSLACSSAEVNLSGDIITISNLLAPNEIVKIFASDNRIVYNCFRNCGEVQMTRPLAIDTYNVDIEFYTENWQFICSENVSISVGENIVDNGDNTDDSGGNEDPCISADCEQIAPEISNVAPDLTVNFDAIPDAQNPTVMDNCDMDLDITFNEIRIDNENTNNYVLTRTWMATDDCGNTATAKQAISVIGETTVGGDNGDENDNIDPCIAEDCETIPPIIANIPADLTVKFDEVPAPALPLATDNCDTEVELSLEETISESLDARNYTLTRTWTAIDDCGNKNTKKQVIIVIDKNGNGNDDMEDENEPPSDECANVEVTITSGKIQVNNVNSPNRIIKLFDENYQIIAECASDCSQPVAFDLPSIGNYRVDVQLYSDNWTFICEIQKPITITTDNEGNETDEVDNPNYNPCETVEINSSSSAIIISNFSNNNKIVNIFDKDYKLIYNCFTDCPTEINAPITDTGIYFVDIQLYSIDWNLVCQNRTTVEISGENITDNDLNEQIIDCDSVQISSSTTQIRVTNLTAPNSVIKVFNKNYDLISECIGNCRDSVIVTNLVPGDYKININYFDENWEAICERIESISLKANFLNNPTINSPATSLKTIPSTGSLDFEIYPNPATNEVYLDLKAVKEQKIKLSIYNQFAVSVWQSSIEFPESHSQRIDVSHLPDGLYFLYLEANDQIYKVKKLAINKVQ